MQRIDGVLRPRPQQEASRSLERWSRVCTFYVDAGEDIPFSRTYGGPGTEDTVSCCRAGNGGYLLVGRTDSYGKGEADLAALCIRPDGEIEWQYTYGGPKEDRPGCYGTAAIPCRNGGYLISAVTGSWGVSGKLTPWLLKLNEDGSIAWQRWYGNRYSSYSRNIVLEDSMGNIILVTTYQSGEDTGSRDIWVIKLSPDGGDVLWQRTYGGREGEYPYTAAISKSGVHAGDYLIGGFTYSQDIGFLDPNVSNGLFLRLEPAKGNIRAARHYGWDTDWYEYEYIMGLTETENGNLLFIGASGSSRMSQGFHSKDIWIGRSNPWGVIDTEANVLLHGFGEDWHDRGCMIVPARNGDVLFCGRMNRKYSEEEKRYFGDDPFIASCTFDAELLWSKYFVTGYRETDYFRGIIPTGNGYLLNGVTEFYASGGSDLWLMKTGNEKQIESGTELPQLPRKNSVLQVKERPFQQGDTFAISAEGILFETGSTDAVPVPSRLESTLH